VTGDTDLVLKASTDVLTLAEGGAKAMARDLAEELASKKTEMARIDESSEYAVKLAESTKTTYPAEVTFSYTVRDAFGDLITKTEVLVVNDEAEAMSASATVLRNITGRTKLKDLMIIDIQQKQAHLEATTKALPDFLRSLQALLNEVIANLQ
jgi:phosphopantetheine adenylyltransferase